MEKLTYVEMVDLIAKLQAGEGDDEEVSEWLDRLSFSLGNPHVSNLIFHSKERLTPQQIIERAQQYKPFQMPPPPSL